MTQKDKLITLINSVPRENKQQKSTAEQIANHLIANNVIVLPCALGSTVWVISKSCAEPFSAKFRLDDIDQFGKRVFLTRAEALRRMRGAKR